MVKCGKDVVSLYSNLRKPYEQIVASKCENEKIKTLKECISRTTRLIQKDLRNFDKLKDLGSVLCFMEQLLNMLNKSHILLESEMDDFDKRTLPIMEKYASLLVFQSSRSYTPEEGMKKLREFLSSLPVHHSTRITPQARLKNILTLLLSTTQTNSSEHSEGKSKKQSKKRKDGHQLETENIELAAIFNQPEASPVNSTKLALSKFQEQHPVCNRETNPETTEELNNNYEDPKMFIEESLLDNKPKAIKVKDVTLENGKAQEDTDQEDFLLRALPVKMLTVANDDLVSDLALSLSDADSEKIILAGDAKFSDRRTDLQELRKLLRNRFRVPWNVTTTEKFLMRKLLRLLKSNRPPKTSVWKVSDLKCVPLSPKTIIHLESPVNSNASCSFNSCDESKPVCDASKNPVTPVQSQLNCEKPAMSCDDSFFSCNTPRSDSLELQSPTHKEDPFDKLKNLSVSKPTESELTLSDIELMEEMEVTLRRLEKENELSDKGADLLANLLPIQSLPDNPLEKLPTKNTDDEHKELEVTAKSLNTTNKPSATTSSTDRRRSPRLAGITSLPLIYTQLPLPRKRKVSTPSTTNSSLEQTANSQKNEDTSGNSVRGTPPMPPCKKTKYNDPEKPDIYLTPNLPKKPIRRRIVSDASDPYLFVASDEELVVEEQKTTVEMNGHSKDFESLKPGNSTLHPSSDLVGLSSSSDTEIVFSTKNSNEQTRNKPINQAVIAMPITPDSETGSHRASSSLNNNVAQDERSNDSVIKIAMSSNNNANVSHLDHAAPMFNKITWQEIRKLIPACWADILEQHIKSNHPDQVLLCQGPDEIFSNTPTVYCCKEVAAMASENGQTFRKLNLDDS